MAIWKFIGGDGVSEFSASRFLTLQGDIGTLSDRFADGTADSVPAANRLDRSGANAIVVDVAADTPRTRFQEWAQHTNDTVRATNRGTRPESVSVTYTPSGGTEVDLVITTDYTFSSDETGITFVFNPDSTIAVFGVLDQFTLSYTQVLPADEHYLLCNATNVSVDFSMPANTSASTLQVVYFDNKTGRNVEVELGDDGIDIKVPNATIGDFAFLNYTTTSISIGLSASSFKTTHGGAGGSARSNNPNIFHDRIYWGRIN